MTIFRVPVTIDYVQPGGPGLNVWHVRTIGPSSSDDTDQLGEALDSLQTFYTAIKTYYAAGTSIRLGQGMIRDPLGSPEYQDDDLRTIAAGGTGDALPAYCAMVAGWRTTSATRSGRGRTFLGPFTETFNGADGQPRAGDVISLQAHLNTLLAASQGPAGWALGVLSVKQGIFRDFTGVTVQYRWAYLSSRRD